MELKGEKIDTEAVFRDFFAQRGGYLASKPVLILMLIEFKVGNFRSIREEQTLSFIASNYSNELPQNLIELDLPGMKGLRLVKAIALYGANASGKSNVLGALQFMAKFVSDSATGIQPGARTGAQPFKLDAACLEAPTRFELMMVVKGVRMLYGLALTQERVTSEYLVAFPNGKPQMWFERDWNGQDYDWSKPNQYFKHDKSLREKTRENASFVSVASQFGNGDAEVAARYFRNLLLVMMDKSVVETTKAALLVEGVKVLLEQKVAAADLGIVSVRSKKLDLKEMALRILGSEKVRSSLPPEVGEGDIVAFLDQVQSSDSTLKMRDIEAYFGQPELMHRTKQGVLVPLDFEEEESMGTRRFLEVLSQTFLAFGANSVAVFDEMEASLHPLLVAEVIRTFLDLPSSLPRCQLIFTTHNPFLLDQTLLRRDQIWFTEKDDEGATRLYPLTDYAPRKDESLVRGYLSGRYGGIPFIPAGLVAGSNVAEKESAAAPAKPIGTKKAVKKGKKPAVKKLAKKGA